jgi:signal transduction histidine kinase
LNIQGPLFDVTLPSTEGCRTFKGGYPVLYEFVTTYRQAIIDRAREKLTARSRPSASANELQSGVPLFLAHLSATLQSEANDTPVVRTAAGGGGTLHGRALLALGFSLSQVVHDYGDICQAVTELAVELNAPIRTEEFRTLNRLLDTAIADAVTEHARLTAESSIAEELERSGMVAHEVRGMLNTALFAFEALKQGTVAINGSTGALLGRSLINLRSFVDSTLSVIRIDGHHERRERILVTKFLDEVVLVSGLRAEYHALDFTIEPIDPQLAVEADRQLLASAVTNLLNNAFKYTHVPGRVTLRAFAAYERLRIEVEDECGGLPDRVADPSMPSGERRVRERGGLGHGLSIARKAVKAQGGDIHTRNIRGKGCVFVIEVPLCLDAVTAATDAGTVDSDQPASP